MATGWDHFEPWRPGHLHPNSQWVGMGGRGDDLPLACTHTIRRCLLGWVSGGGGVRNFYISGEKFPFPPALPLHTCTPAWLIIYRWWCSLLTRRWCSLFTHRMQKNRAFASMRYMLGNFNACVRPVWDGPIVFQRLQHFTTSKSSTGILWGFVRNCESHKVTCLLATSDTRFGGNVTRITSHRHFS